MGRINTGKVILAGLLAGLIINVCEFLINGVVFAADWSAAMQALNKSAEPTAAQIVGFNIWGFAMGILSVWLYAAIRPRFGAGPKTALIAGLVIWLLGYAGPMVFPVMLGLFPLRLAVLTCAIQVAEVAAALLVGARMYQEEPTTHTARATA